MATGVANDRQSPNSSEKMTEKGFETRRESVHSNLDKALESLDISVKDADEAFTFLREHPNADAVRQEALALLGDPKATKKLMRKIDFTIVPCMFAVYFLQFL